MINQLVEEKQKAIELTEEKVTSVLLVIRALSLLAFLPEVPLLCFNQTQRPLTFMKLRENLDC